MERTVGRASVPKTLSNLCPHPVLSRPPFGALHQGQDKWRGTPQERLLPKEQAPPLEWGPLPEQPHWMAKEHSKFGVWGPVGREGLDQRSKRPWSPSTADTRPPPRPLSRQSSGREPSALPPPPPRRPPSPQDPARDQVTAQCLGLPSFLRLEEGRTPILPVLQGNRVPGWPSQALG